MNPYRELAARPTPLLAAIEMRLSRISRVASTLACVSWALLISASAQVITITSPTEGSHVSLPVWLRAHASSCNGSANMTGIGYSVDNSPFITWGKNTTDIDTTEYRLASQPSGLQHTIWFKAWSDKGACNPVPVDVTVSGSSPTTMAANLDQVQNDPNWKPQPCPTWNSTASATNWFWQWDPGTTKCTLGTSNTYIAPSGSPSLDGTSRIFYVDWKSQAPGNSPGERYSELFGTNTTATSFVYDTYIYMTDPQNIQNLELDTNQAYDGSNVLIYGLQCARTSQTTGSWQYTINNGTPAQPQDKWIPTSLACDQLLQQPNTWHHVQLAVHRDSSGYAHYDSITLDGNTTLITWSGPSTFELGWPAGTLLLNFQIDGVPTIVGGEATATLYVDGMTMIYW
jgi:hypothetical protein